MKDKIGQTRLWSAIEAISNITCGFLIAWMIFPPIMAWFGYEIGITKAAGVTAIYTMVSVTRSYLWRRLFNWIEIKRKTK